MLFFLRPTSSILHMVDSTISLEQEAMWTRKEIC